MQIFNMCAGKGNFSFLRRDLTSSMDTLPGMWEASWRHAQVGKQHLLKPIWLRVPESKCLHSKNDLLFPKSHCDQFSWQAPMIVDRKEG